MNSNLLDHLENGTASKIPKQSLQVQVDLMLNNRVLESLQDGDPNPYTVPCFGFILQSLCTETKEWLQQVSEQAYLLLAQFTCQKGQKRILVR